MKFKLFGALCVALLVAIYMLPSSLPGRKVPTLAERAESDIGSLCIALRMFEADHSELPETLDVMKKTYLIPRVFVDPWGREYRYHVRKSDANVEERSWEILTLGRDNEHGGTDASKDISSDSICPGV